MLMSGSSVQFSHSVASNSLRPHGLQHTRLPCPSPTPRAYSNSCPLSQWCHPTISSSVVWVLAGFKSQPRGFESQAGFWLGLSPKHVGSSPKQSFGWVWSPAHEFKSQSQSQSEVNSFSIPIQLPTLHETQHKTTQGFFSSLHFLVQAHVT